MPSPSVPSLPDSLKSTEPGDTVQVPRVSAYYSQYDRKFLTKYYQDKFSLKILGITFPTYRLNHPPEVAREKFRSGIETYYLEEVVIPLRETLFINGWEPDIFYENNPGKKVSEALVIDGKRYSSKTTLRPFYSTFSARMVNFIGIVVSLIILYFLTKKIIFDKKIDD